MRRSLIHLRFPATNLRRFTAAVPCHQKTDDDENILAALTDGARSNKNWSASLNNNSILSRLTPIHIDKFILSNLNDSGLALSFFNFLGLHKNFRHSTTSFCLLVHSLVNSKLYWPVSSLLQTLLEREKNPHLVFRNMLETYKRFDFSSVYGFDMLVQGYLQCRRNCDAVWLSG